MSDQPCAKFASPAPLARSYGAMRDLAAAVAPPSRAHALALEAAIVRDLVYR
jgi:hypothetical protein